MNWTMLWRDILVGLLIAGALGALVPDDFWKAFFLVNHPVLASVWGAIVGPRLPSSPSPAQGKRSVRGRIVERRDKLRRRCRLHLR
jgi:uncharacterized membrane protein YraQ (UPF0718 family)